MADRIHPLTALAATVMFALTVPFALAAWSLWEIGGALDPETYARIARRMAAGSSEVFGAPLARDAAQFWLRVAGATLMVVCLFTSILATGVAARREWGRHAGVLTFLLFALIAVPLGVGGWFTDPRPDGAVSAVVTAIGTSAVVWLLATRVVADDIARASFYRRRRRAGNPVRPTDPPDAHGDPPPEAPVLAA